MADAQAGYDMARLQHAYVDLQAFRMVSMSDARNRSFGSAQQRKR
jgi:hypothetical protein